MDERIENLINDYVDGELGEGARSAFEKRLAQDPKLAAQVEQLQRTVALLGDLPEVEPPADLLDNILGATVHKSGGWQRLKDFLFPERQAPWAAIAAGAIACMVLVVVLTVPGLNLQKQSVPPLATETIDLAAKSTRTSAKLESKAAVSMTDKLTEMETGKVAKEQPAARMAADDLADTSAQKEPKPSPRKSISFAPAGQSGKEKKGEGKARLGHVSGVLGGAKADHGLAGEILPDTDADANRAAAGGGGIVAEKASGGDVKTLDRRNEERDAYKKAKRRTKDNKVSQPAAAPPPPMVVDESYRTRAPSPETMAGSAANGRAETKRSVSEVTPVSSGSRGPKRRGDLDTGPMLKFAEEKNLEEAEEQKAQSLLLQNRFDGVYSGVRRYSTAKITDAGRWAALWKDLNSILVPARPIPNVDFNRSFVVGLFLGTKSTGGYQVKIMRVEVRDEKIIVVARLTTPRPGMIITQALTQPYSLVIVDKPADMTVDQTTPIEFVYE